MADTIGARLRYWRARRGGITQQVLADRAGVSRAYISLIESGRRTVERRRTLIALAGALDVRAEELSGYLQPGDRVREEQSASMARIRTALLERTYGCTLAEVPDSYVDIARQHYMDGRYHDFLHMLPDLLCSRDPLHALAACNMAIYGPKWSGAPDLAHTAARLGMALAEQTEDPALVGLAGFWLGHAFPDETSSLAAQVSDTEAQQLEPHVGGSRQAREAYGMLRLTAAWRLAAANAPKHTVLDHLAEAEHHARALGQPDDAGFGYLEFGPTNVQVWRVRILTEVGEVDEALDVAARVEPGRLFTLHRRAAVHIEHARALVAAERDAEAVVQFVAAERVCPLRVRIDVGVREMVTAIRLRTVDRAVPDQLQQLCRTLEVEAAELAP